MELKCQLNENSKFQFHILDILKFVISMQLFLFGI